MELSDLRIFLAVADEQGFTAASRKLNCVQPNVTARIRKLEEELGAPLFYRQSRGVALTPQGRQFYAYADRIVRLSQEACKSLQSQAPGGPLSIGVTQTVASAYLPEILLRFHTLYPEVELTVRTLFGKNLTEDLLDHTLDYALIEIPVSHPELVSEGAWEQDLVRVAAKSYTEGSHGVTALVFSSSCPYRKAMLETFAREGISIARQLKLLNVETVLACVIGGVGVSVLPARLVYLPHIAPQVTTWPVHAGDGTATIRLIRHRESFATPQALAFSQMVKEVMHRTTEEFIGKGRRSL